MNKNGPKMVHPFARHLFIVLLSILSGCTSIQSYPDKAFPGDTITLAVGSADGMNRSNTSIEFVADSDPFNPVDLTPGIRAITKIYPDRTSNAWLFDNTFTGNIPEYSSHGPWESIIVIDLPTVMPIGTGYINVTTGAIFPQTTNHVNNVPISFEILNGLGAPNPFNYRLTGTLDVPGALSEIEPLPQVVVRQPVQSQGWTTYGAIEVKVRATIKTAGGLSVPDSDIRVVVDDMGLVNLNSQRQSFWKRVGKIITVSFVSPNGTMKYYEPRFSVVTKPGNVFEAPAPTLESITYYDVDGNVTTGPLPTVTVE